jgi:hypothetical protein
VSTYIVHSIDAGDPIGYQVGVFSSITELCHGLDELIDRYGSVVVSRS